MIRTVLAVVLAIALLTATLPAIETVRVDRVDHSVSQDLATIEHSSTELLTTEERIDGPGAQRVVSVSVPPRGLVTADLQYIELTADAFTYKISGQSARTVRPDAPIVRPDAAGPLRITTSTDILLRPIRDNGTRKVVMTRIGVSLNRSEPPEENRTADDRTPENRTESSEDPPHSEKGSSSSDDGSLWEWVTGIKDTILGFIP